MSNTIIQAENTLLGRIMLDNSLLMEAELGAADFISAQHRQVFEAICMITADGEVAEPVTVAEFLERSTGRSWLKVTAGMVVDNFRGSGIEGYSRAIKQAARTRKALEIASQLHEGANGDVAEAIDQAIRQLMQINATAKNWNCTLRTAIGEAIDMIDKAQQADGKPSGIQTSIRDLDEQLGGLHGGDFVVVGARPAQGKTAWGLNLLLGCGRPSGFISGEQGRGQVGMRSLAISGSISLHNMRRGKMDDEEWQRVTEAANAAGSKQVWIFDRPRPSIQDICAQARRWRYENKIDLLLVDYLQMIQGGAGRDLRLQIGDIAGQLKALARELDIPVVSLAQLNREVEKRPMGEDGLGRMGYMGDFSESGLIEPECDQALTLYRPYEYAPQEEWKGKAFINVCKNRHGPTGVIPISWRGEYLQFGDLAHTEEAARW